MSGFPKLTRRGLFRAGATAGVATVAVGLLDGCRHSGDEASDPVVVDDRAALNILDEEKGYSESDLSIEEKGSWELPVGTVLRQAEGTWLPALTYGATALPMTKAAVFSTSSGELKDVVTKLTGGDEPNTSIYDVRCSDSVYAWVEMNMLARTWVLCAQRLDNGSASGNVATLWEGDSDWDPPLFAVTGNTVIWQVAPSLSGTRTRDHSFCYLWHLGDKSAQSVVESPGRFAAPPAISDGTVTLAPRVRADEGIYYGITAYSLKNDMETVVDQLVLPQSVRPFRAVRMGDRFAFSVEANYSSGGLLGRMGTYIGAGDGPFITLTREPSAQVAGKGDVFVVKSRASYFVINVARETYSILSAANHCVDYGEFPASEGVCSNFVTFATVKSVSTGYPSAVVVRNFAL